MCLHHTANPSVFLRCAIQMPDNLPILLVEDNDDDLFFFRRLIGKAGLNPSLSVATDGQQAVEQLKRLLPNGELPRLIFLDLKLPLRGGFEVLQWIRSQPSLAGVVVAVLSSSAEARDVEQAYALGAQGYLVKYPDPAVFQEIFRLVAALPAGTEPGSLRLPGIPRP
jgi:CheY-like chemotaxis protein